MTSSLSAPREGSSPPDLLRRVLDPREKLPGTLPEDYGLARGNHGRQCSKQP